MKVTSITRFSIFFGVSIEKTIFWTPFIFESSYHLEQSYYVRYILYEAMKQYKTKKKVVSRMVRVVAVDTSTETMIYFRSSVSK